jgi:predicted dinucleotide-binding enzyme
MTHIVRSVRVIKCVGIIGAGRIGQAMARIARRAGRPVMIANRKGPQSLASLVQELGDVSGDDADAKYEVGGLFEAAGFFVIDLGGLREGGQMQQFGGPLAGQNLIRFA